MEVIIATQNKHKLKECVEILEPLGIHPISLKQAGIETINIEETGSTYSENAVIKAKAIFDILNVPVIADDSGFQIDVYPEILGVYSARFMPELNEKETNAYVLELMKQESCRNASYQASVVYYDGEAHIFEACVDGVVSNEIRGDHGFGFDPIFIPEGSELTFGEMDENEKHKISHRGKALSKLNEFLKEYI